jgi:hypothetical protein
MMRPLAVRVFTGVLALAAVAGLVRAAPRTSDEFPHVVHERLFPVCESCHLGVASDDAATLYPAPSDCARCHDDTRASRVAWRGPAPRASNLRFSHAQHALAAPDEGPPSCQACHAQGDDGGRMAVGAAHPDLCLRCHEHRAVTHLDDAVACGRCHVPLAEAPAIASARIAAFPQPDWHQVPDFIASHGLLQTSADATCAMCHARESCERCHANAAQIPLVQELPRDPRVAALEMDRLPVYPVPHGHTGRGWHEAHGPAARAGAAGCANCHTQPGCTACHTGDAGSAAAAIQSLPPRGGPAPGVDPARMRQTVHGADVKLEHGALAASGRLDCAQCHARTDCTSCHAAVDSRSFHGLNFVERHAVDVFAGRGECQACHSMETFCRACHVRTGAAAQNMKASFHDGQPMWILSHGQAARLGLETCASCHRQNDCVQCHSAAGGWGVNPHGPGFTGGGASRSGASCRLCHQSTPGRGGP